MKVFAGIVFFLWKWIHGLTIIQFAVLQACPMFSISVSGQMMGVIHTQWSAEMLRMFALTGSDALLLQPAVRTLRVWETQH